MVRIIKILLILSCVNSYGQKTVSDSVSKYTSMGFDYMLFNSDSAIAYFSEAIDFDSSYFEPYFLRGTAYVMNESFFLNDSNDLKKAIPDFIKCINLKNTAYKIFPDTSILNFVAKCNPRPSGLLDNQFDLQSHSYDILQGVLALLNNGGRNNSIACAKFIAALTKGKKEVQLLIDEFCN